MRSKSPGREKRSRRDRDRRSYSSDTSYSSNSSSSHTASTTGSSRSPTPTKKRVSSHRDGGDRRYGRSPPGAGQKVPKFLRSSSPSPPKRRYSPGKIFNIINISRIIIEIR